MNDTSHKLLVFAGNPFILGLLTVFGYFGAYYYQMGYLHYFGIPSEYIDLTISSVMFGLSATIVYYLLFFYLIYHVITYKKIKRIEIVAIAILFSVPAIFFYWPFTNWFGIVKAVGFISGLCIHLYLLFLTLRLLSFQSRLRDMLFRTHLILFYFFIFALFYLMFMFYVKGSIDASRKQTHYILSVENRKFGVIGYYRDQALLLEVDKKNAVVGGKLFFFKFDDPDFYKYPAQFEKTR